MSRPRRTAAAAALLAAVLGGVAACSGDAGTPPEAKASSTRNAPAEGPYAASLELEDLPGGPSASPRLGQPRFVTVTNNGKKKDAYLLRIDPPGIGGVTPAAVELAPGASVQVRVSMRPTPPGEEDPAPSLVAVSRATADEVARVEIPVPEPASR